MWIKQPPSSVPTTHGLYLADPLDGLSLWAAPNIVSLVTPRYIRLHMGSWFMWNGGHISEMKCAGQMWPFWTFYSFGALCITDDLLHNLPEGRPPKIRTPFFCTHLHQSAPILTHEIQCARLMSCIFQLRGEISEVWNEGDWGECGWGRDLGQELCVCAALIDINQEGKDVVRLHY